MRRLVALALLTFNLDAAAGERKRANKRGQRAAAEAPEPPQAPPAAPALSVPGWAADVPESGQILRLLDPGAEPRAVRAFRPTAGSTARFTMSNDMQMSMTMGGIVMPSVPIPTQVMEMETVVDEVNPDGSAVVTTTLVDVRLVVGPDSTTPPQVAQAMAAALEPLRGMETTVEMDQRGNVVMLELTVAPDTPPELQAQLDQMANAVEEAAHALPSEPIGVGASWEVLQHTAAGGFALGQREVWTLDSMSGDTLVLSATVEQSALDATLTVPNLPPEAKATVRSLSSSGASSMEVDLNRIGVAFGAMAMDLSMAMELDMPGMPRSEMTMDMGLEVTFAPVD